MIIRYEWEISVWLIVLVFIILIIAAFVAHGQEIPGYCEGNITWLDREFCGLPP